MRIHNLVIIFVVIAICFFAVLDIKSNNLEEVINNKERIERNITTAIDDGVGRLVLVSDNNKLTINRHGAVNSFFASLYSSFGITDDRDSIDKLNQYVPVITITTDDGYYIFYSDVYKASDGYMNVSKRWTEKLPYYYEDENFIYSFTFGEVVSLYDKTNCLSGGIEQKVYIMNYHDLRTKDEYSSFRSSHPDCILLNDEKFEIVRKESILKCIESSMAYYTSHHNRIAAQYGITYNFSLPPMKASEWAPYLDDVSMFVVFQGYPYGDQVGEVYNRIASAGAKISKYKMFYLEQIDWYYVYHRSSCPELDNGGLILFDEPLYSIEECAKRGAYACPVCNGESGVNAPNYTP